MHKNISIIGVPMDLGQSRRGVDMGPSAIRYANLVNRLEKIGHTVTDTGILKLVIQRRRIQDIIT